MSSRKWVSFLGCLTPILLLLAGCSDDEGKGGDSWVGICIDADGDGYGFQCTPGADCNDGDPTIHTDCPACERPAEGCACSAGTAAVDCALEPELTKSGSLLCREGTRYCRDGFWSACEGISSFTAPPPSRLAFKLQGLVSGDAGRCSECNPDCYEVDDPLEPVGMDGGTESGIAYGTGGGITLSGSGGSDAAVNPDEVTYIPPCDTSPTSIDKDCDQIPDALDPFPGEVPFESDNATIFMDLPPGTSKSSTFDLSFFLRTADVYFLVDMTGSMGEEQANLIASLQNGNFLNDPSTPEDESAQSCADRNFDNVADDELKDKGIAGNIACLIRDSAFGAGWYREVPFSAADKYGIRYSYPNFEAFEHRLDITSDVTALGSALNLFSTRGNQNWAEAGTLALSAVATGGPIYMGWDRPAIPPRVCPAGHFGYPCFREGAVPIVILITDAPLMNGPVPSAGNLGTENTYNEYGDRQPVNYDAQGLRYMSRSSDGVYYPVSGNESFASAYDVGVIGNSFKTYTGDTRSMAADIHAGNLGYACSSWPSNAGSAASPGYPDAVFKFTVESTKTLTVSTRGTRFKPTLAISSSLPASSVAAANNATPASAQNLGSLGTSFFRTISGDTDPSAFTTGDLPSSALSECLRGQSVSTTAPDAWFRFTVPADLTNVEFSVDGSDFDAVLGLWSSPPVPPVALTSSALGTNDKFNTAAAALPSGSAGSPGTIDNRSLWLTGGSTSASGFNADYGAGLFQGVDSSCSGTNGTVADAVVDFRVAGPGAKTVRIETTSNSDQLGSASFDHVVGLFTRPTSGTSLPTASACNRNGAGTRRSFIERTLNPGTYSVVVRGESSGSWWSSADRGTYGLLISDAAARATACTLESTSRSFTADLKAGVTYYLGMRGRSTSNGGGRGPYTVTLNSHGGANTCAFDNTTYSAKTDDSSMNLGAAEITQTFSPGTYYAVIKGNANLDNGVPSSDTGRGWYQITFGDPTLATNNLTASMPLWGSASSGVQKQLADKGIRVITVASTLPARCGTDRWGNPTSCTGGAANANTALLEQGRAISAATGATDTSGNSLVFEIANDGTGMGNAIVSSVNRLAKNLSMDLSVRFVPLPDTPSPPFIFRSRAVTGTNGCRGTSDANSDNIPDTHLDCAPGATPRFEVTFSNPSSPNNVPSNPAAGSNGGYNMRIELIADGQYVIDTTPVFLVPEDVHTDPNEFQYDQQGWYTQDISSNCAGTDRPNWQSLAWTATVPEETAIDWRICTGDSTAELDACQGAGQWVVAAHIVSGAECSTSSQCPNGYCSADTCHYPTGPSTSCGSDLECGTNGVCASGKCAWTGNPVSLLPTLQGGRNGKAKMRLQAQLTANSRRTAAPTVQDYRVIYVCTPGL